MRNHIVDSISALAKFDERIVMVTADLGYGVLETFEHKFPERFVNCGIAEQNMAAVSAGLAMEGDIVFMYSIGNFPTLRCLEQIRNDICYHNANVKILAVGGGFSYGSLGMTHHATEDLSIMRTLPNMRVYAPADPIEADLVLKEVYQNDGPCYVRLARGGDPVQDTKCIISMPVVATEVDVAILSTGTIYAEGKYAQEQLGKRGLKVSLYSFPQVKPLDDRVLKEIAKNAKLIVTVEENQISGGFGGAVVEILADKIHPPVLRIGLNDTYTSVVGDQMFLRRYYKMDGESITERILQIWGELNLCVR